MTTTMTDPYVHRMEDSRGSLERALIEDFLRAKDIDAATLTALPAEEANHVLAEASVYATNRLAEIQARAHFVHELHREESGQ